MAKKIQKDSIFFQKKTLKVVSKKKKQTTITEHSFLNLIKFTNENGFIGVKINKFCLLYIADKLFECVLPIILSFFRS